ncbi:hypothetical protein [Bacillus sp. SD088]|uniref:hypothetical protein n=1 Tax=Bacillus sp. SD088 TaxID=2782012 RepID=UPI001A9569EE|nr:hypothetical protein [Bacillus sp. SD088]MBO0992409.1 hypothetical protein [Bacillus sp. SD088]
MFKKAMTCAMMLCSMLLIAACEASIDKEQRKAVEQAEKAFDKEPEEANQEIQSIAFYLPSGMSIKDDKPNNIILDKQDHPYILFYNPNEEEDSQALYNLLIDTDDSLIINQTFTKDDRFGYLVITEIEEEETYEVTAGIGGTKATTESAVQNVSEDAKLLMDIVRSSRVE